MLPHPRRARGAVFPILWLLSGAALPAVPAPGEPAFRVGAMELDLGFDLEHGVLEQTARLWVEGHGVSELRFEIHEGLLVERSSASSGVIEHRKIGSRLRALVHPPLDGRRELTFRIRGTFNTQARASRITTSGIVLDPADRWYPWVPGTWARAALRLRLPEGWTAVGPGVPAGPPGSHGWRSDRPLRELAVAARPRWRLSQGRVVQTPFYAASPEGEAKAEELVAHFADPFAWFAGALAAYPFESLQVAFDPWLERSVHASGVVLWPGPPPGTRAEAADMLADQWFGQRVSATGAWIEAFAAWQVATYCRDRGLALPPRLAELRRLYLEGSVAKDVPLRAADARTDPVVLRGKGSAAPEMVRLGVESRKFFAALRDWFLQTETDHAHPWTFEEVVALFDARTENRAEHLFAQWFERTGAPEIEVELRAFPAAEGGWRADIAVIQASPPYTLPLEVILHGPGAVHQETIEIEQAQTRVFYVVPFRPARVEADPQGKLFVRRLVARLRDGR